MEGGVKESGTDMTMGWREGVIRNKNRKGGFEILNLQNMTSANTGRNGDAGSWRQENGVSVVWFRGSSSKFYNKPGDLKVRSDHQQPSGGEGSVGM